MQASDYVTIIFAILLVVSEVLPFLPVKANGISHAIHDVAVRALGIQAQDAKAHEVEQGLEDAFAVSPAGEHVKI
jgi:hypothetical protein